MATPPRKPRSAQRAMPAAEPLRSRTVTPRRGDPNQPDLFAEPLPGWIAPCRPVQVDQAPSGPDWSHEVKWDGYRVCARVEGATVAIRTGLGADWTARFPGIAAALARLPVRNAVVDGEAVVLDAQGISRFAALQAALAFGRAAEAAALVAFDLLFLDGLDLRGWSLVQRRDALATVIAPGNATLLFSEEIAGDGPDVQRMACAHRLEGLVSKRRLAPYRSGRSDDWLMTDRIPSGTFTVIGYEPSGRTLGSLRVAEQIGGELVPVGRVGTGFTITGAAAIKQRLDAIATSEPPIHGSRSTTTVWVRPELRIAVTFRDRTADGQLRHAAFKGVREDL